jgi:hypothetical protein
MYGTKVDANSTFSMPEVGIVENVEIEKISYSDEHNRLDFEFKQPNGSFVKHSEFEANESFGKVEEQAENTSRKVKHIVTKFMPEEAFVIENVTSFGDYAKKVVQQVGESYKGKKFRMLFIYRGKYVDIPRYPNFIESMDVPASETSVHISNFNKTKLVAQLPNTEEDINMATANVKSTDDLPF